MGRKPTVKTLKSTKPLSTKENQVNFTDQKGRVYECKVTLATAIVFKKMGLDLSKFDGQFWEKVATDMELLVNILAESVRESMTTMGITPQQFAESIGGDSLENATNALLEAIADFSPPLQRAALRKLIQKSKEVQVLAGERMNRMIDQVTPEQIYRSMNGSITTPESSDCRPANSTTSTPDNSTGSSEATDATNGTDTDNS